ncbi:MAG: glycosyltransferase, partial [Ignavibacteria bacterium]|nr:glycosyltransferase [Ignavibacteria bacterium]
MKALVIIPTYNEIHNIKRLLPDILSSFPSIDVLIVDDNSPDGTAGWVKEAAKTVPRIKIIERPGKMGLGTAYVAGFKY